MADTLYEVDFMLWAEQEAEQLRRAAREGSNLPLDWENLAEEIESLGRSQRREVGSLARQIMTHLIKLAYSPATPNWFSWETEISGFRDLLHRTLDDSPSIKPSFPDIVRRESRRAVRFAVSNLRKFRETEAAGEVERTTFAFTPEQVLDEDWFLPGTYERIRAQLTAAPA